MAILNSVGNKFFSLLNYAKQATDEIETNNSQLEKVNIVGAGGVITAVYEQLRNAAENTEEHLLLQGAVWRFYKQLFIAHNETILRDSGMELATELTFAGYIPNDSLTRDQIDAISESATRHFQLFENIRQEKLASLDLAMKWTLSTLAIEVANIIYRDYYDEAYVAFAYDYFEKLASPKNISVKDDEEYRAALYTAIHRALLKADDTQLRSRLLERYEVKSDANEIKDYVDFNRQIDKLLTSSLVEKLYRIVNRQGAPLRIIRQMIKSDPDFIKKLSNREVFLEEFEKNVKKESSSIMKRVDRAIVRSVIFLIVTKVLIGVAIEVPYDIWANGEIAWIPLLINLLFPPVYMVMLRLTLTPPGFANTQALVYAVDSILYGDDKKIYAHKIKEKRYSSSFSIIYAILSLSVVAVVTWLLLLLDFSVVHIIIFFVFISAASFLGFRLSRLVRELEITRSASNGLTFIRDVIYLPFVVIGQWMSDKYSRMNIVTIILDLLIEMPMKTILRTIRQWCAFMDDRKDNI